MTFRYDTSLRCLFWTILSATLLAMDTTRHDNKPEMKPETAAEAEQDVTSAVVSRTALASTVHELESDRAAVISGDRGDMVTADAEVGPKPVVAVEPEPEPELSPLPTTATGAAGAPPPPPHETKQKARNALINVATITLSVDLLVLVSLRIFLTAPSSPQVADRSSEVRHPAAEFHVS